MAQKFHQELNLLKNDVMAMGLLAGDMLSKAVQAFKTLDINLAEIVISQKESLADNDDKIETSALKLMTLYQPMARDVRTIACILKVITYLNRIGRYGKDIAKVATEIQKESHIAKLVNIPNMALLAGQMIDDVLNAFNTGDLSRIGVKSLTERDNNLDAMRYSIFRECISYMLEDPRTITICSNYIMVARYLERCGDHACKMAEKIWFMETGKRVEIS